MNKPYLVVANWKMQLTCNTAVQMCLENHHGLATLAQKKNIRLVLCPSAEALYPIAHALKGTTVHVGAQTCSKYKQGAHTGQIAATSLAEIGCSYCIIGHSEERIATGETNLDIALKAERLLERGIHPIICIGETQQEYHQGLTIHALHEQLEPILQLLARYPSPGPITLAYEPIWAIGTGKVPPHSYLVKIFTWLAQITTTLVPAGAYTLIYGGSVTPETLKELLTIEYLEGLLVGSASLDFQKFENIVSLISEH